MQEDERGNLVAQHVAGTAEDARSKVRAYFDDLRETVNRQEEAGLAVVNNYVREKLLSLRQQQEDMAVLMSQVTSVCVECDRALKRSDAEVMLFYNINFILTQELNCCPSLVLKTTTCDIYFCTCVS